MTQIAHKTVDFREGIQENQRVRPSMGARHIQVFLPIQEEKAMSRLSIMAKVPVLVLASIGFSGLALAGSSGSSGPDATSNTSQTTRTLPPGLRPAVYQALAKDAGPVYSVNKDGCVSPPKQTLTACFNNQGVRFSGVAKPLSLHLAAFGREDAIKSVEPVQPVIKNNWVRYHHGSLTEWWRILPGGFEQGFSIADRPAGQGKLILELSSNGQASQHHGTLAWGRLHYGGLVVIDAKGRIVPSLFRTQGKRVQIVVYDTRAVYPLTVDPLVWLEQKVVSSDGVANDIFGVSAVVSGNTAIVGALYATVTDNTPGTGAAYVFNRSNGKWNETQKLTPSDGEADDMFGTAVALQGNTAFIGSQFAPFDPISGPGPGAVYVFTKANGVWSQTQKLTVSDGVPFAMFGHNIAPSGNTVFIGAQSAPATASASGAVYVFDKSNGSWTQTQKLTPGPDVQGTFGASLAFDGTTALVGVQVGACIGQGCPPLPAGSGLIYTDVGGTWTQAQELTVPESECSNNFATTVAIDSDTAMIGCGQFLVNPGDENSAIVFTKSGGTWSETQQLVPSDGGPGVPNEFGEFLALSGNTALIAAPDATIGDNLSQGAAYLFTETNGVWNQTLKLVASDGRMQDEFGNGIPALDGTTALIGVTNAMINFNFNQGAAYFYSLSNLDLAVNAPQTVSQGQNYVSQTIATNNAGANSPAVTATIAVPAAASFISASTSQGDCSYATGTVTCDFGVIGGNAGMATANLTLRAVRVAPYTIDNTASIAKATPALTASGATTITPINCPNGYTVYSGSLSSGEVAHSPVYQARGGVENAILTAPARFQLYAVYQSGSDARQVYLVPGNEVHRWGPKGSYMWLVRARDGAGAYTLCLQHP